MNNSGKRDGLTHPFGYLKASSSLTHVTLFVMPFNYRELLPLAGELALTNKGGNDTSCLEFNNEVKGQDQGVGFKNYYAVNPYSKHSETPFKPLLNPF